MSTAYLRDPELLATLGEALQEFAMSARLHLQRARDRAEEVEAELVGRRRSWEDEVRRLEALADAASTAGEPVNWRLQMELAEAQNVLAIAWRSEEEVRAAQHTLEANRSRYERVLEQCESARTSLLDTHAAAGVYEGVAPQPAAAAAPAAASAGAGAGRGVGAVPTYMVQGQTFSTIPLGMFEDPVFAPGEFQQADFQDMRQSMGMLPVLLRAVQDGSVDQLLANDPSLQRSFDWFFRSESIKGDWINGRFELINGRHRVAVARRLGVAALPAMVMHHP